MKKPRSHHPRQCRDLFARMSQYLDHEMDESRSREFAEHLQDCPSCRVCLVTLQRTVALCRALPAPEVRKEFSDRLVEALMRLSKNLYVER